MRIVTFNLLHGRSVSDGVIDTDRITSGIAALDADVLAVQEVDRAQPRSGGIDLAAMTADAVGAAHFRFEPALVGTPGGQWRAAQDGEHGPSSEPMYGVAIASRLPVQSWHVQRLAAAPVHAPILIPGTRRPMLLKDEPRVGLAAVLSTPTGPMTVATTHLSFVPGWNVWQLRLFTRFLLTLPAPRILLGDLNLPGRVPATITRWRSLAAAATYPNDNPKVQLDHVLAESSAPPEVLDSAAVAMPFSDHRALTVDLGGRGDLGALPR